MNKTVQQLEAELSNWLTIKDPSDHVIHRIKLIKAELGFLQREPKKPEKRIEETPIIPRKRGRPRKARK